MIKRLIRQAYYGAALLFSRIVLLLPYRQAVTAGGMLGSLACALVGKARSITEENLRASFPEKSDEEIRTLASGVFKNQGKNLFELFSFPKLDKDDVARIVTIEGRENMEKALARGKGVLIASAHCGNWEMMGAALAGAGFPINVIARRIYIEGLNRMLVSLRESKGERVILRSGKAAARDMLRALRHGETIAMLIDQDTSVPGVFVEYFGRPAWTPSGLATLALRTGAPVVLALDARMSDDSHRVILTGPFDPATTGDTDADIRNYTQFITCLIEAHVRALPDQWVWMHERWKTKKDAVQ